MGHFMKTYRGFLLDADNTLFDYTTAEEESLEEACREAAPDVSSATALSAYRRINAEYWKRFEQGSITLEDLKVGRFADLLRELRVPGDPRAVSDRYLSFLSRKAYFLPHAREAVREISRTAALCLVTNGISVVQRGRLAASGIAEYFTAILISEELGMAKPDPRFFHAACDALKLRGQDLLCVGDSPVADIEGARAAGIDACWYAPKDTAWPGPGDPPALVIQDLAEIIKFAGGVYP